MTPLSSDSRGPVPDADDPAGARLLHRRERAPATGDELAHPRRRFLLRLLFRTSLVVCLVVLAGTIAAILWLRHSMRAALPQIEGTLHVAGLRAPVIVTRDAHGVPSISAANLDDLLFAQGFVTAQDRLWKMDAVRRHAAGDLAEIFGPGMIYHDTLQRTLQLRAAADRAIAVLPPDQLHQLQAYARGVNAFIDTHRDRLPVEFHLLHYQPAAWQPRDSLLIYLAMWQDLSTGFPTTLKREELSTHLPPDLLADLYPVGSWRDRPPTQPPPDLTTPRQSIEQIPLDSTQSSVHSPASWCPGSGFSDAGSQDLCGGPTSSPELQQLAAALTHSSCDSCRSGSNNWAIAGARSASGFPLVSNDMHLGLDVPDIWYEAALHTTGTGPQLDAAGFTLPGVPFIVAGRNAHVAWGFTNLGADVQDVRVEHTRGSGSHAEFQLPDGSWQPVQHHAELIRVRAGRDIQLDVLSTAQTIGSTSVQVPLISTLSHTERRALSLAWPVYDPSSLNNPFLAVNTAADGGALVAAFATFGGPTLNLVYADDARHIGYHAIGRIPIRGPAVRHPRPLQPTVLPQGAMPETEESEDQGPSAEPSDESESLPVAAKPTPGAAQPAVPDLSIPPAAKPLDYTIGSPISPVPVDALDPAQQWTAYIPYNELPSVIDPPLGIVATANARITADDYPYAVALNWADPYRVERIYTVLTPGSGLTPADMLALQNDVHSELDLAVAHRLAYALDHASSKTLAADAARLRQAADLLRAWDGDLTVVSPAAAIAVAARSELWPMLLVPQIAAHDHLKPNSPAVENLASLYSWGERNTALETILLHQPARWLPAGFSTWSDFLSAAVERGLHNAHAPSNLASWTYGAYHPTEIGHPIFGSNSLLSRVLGVRTGSGLQPAPGDGVTVRASGLHFGPSERFTADLSSPSLTNANITTGESGNPASPFYLDQFLPWLHGTTFSLPLEPSPAHTLTLTPN